VAGEAAQLVVDDRYELVERRAISAAPVQQQARYFVL
jgi:hypothetical protein